MICRPARLTLAVGAVLLAVVPTRAADLQLELPIRCTLGRDCVIQNHFDHDPGPGWRDYACGPLAYDGHTGTDFRLLDRRQMQAGVEVLAAAAGTVVGVRDGEADVALPERTTPLRPERAAGNGVRIAHGDGWETQYSHLRRGSVRVRNGDRVAVGTPLGLVGLSGRTEFPHVDFSVRRHGRTLDPFAPAGGTGCGAARDPLWSAAALAGLGYRASGILAAGFATRSLGRTEMESGTAYVGELAATAPAIVFHVEVFGVRAGDIEEVQLLGPDGVALAERRETLPRNLAVRRAWLGKRLQQPAWTPGEFTAHYRLLRGDAVVASRDAAVRVAAVAAR